MGKTKNKTKKRSTTKALTAEEIAKTCEEKAEFWSNLAKTLRGEK